MSEKVLEYYDEYTKKGGEENRAEVSRFSGLEFHYTKKAMREFITRESRVLEVGCGTGYYGLFFADKCKEYIGIELYPPHIEIFSQKINERGLKNVSCRYGNALNLEAFADGGVDVVCCFGPMYHLPPEDRARVFAECARVCKPGGIAAFAYINKVGAYAGACVHDEGRAIYPNAHANATVLKHGTDDLKPGVFFYTMPEEIEAAAAAHGFEKIRNTGTDFFVMSSVIDKMDDEKFALFMELSDEMTKYESCTGMSNHALLICRRRA